MEAIQFGRCPDVPAELYEFYRVMFTGSKIKLVKEWNDTSNHQLKMTYTHGAVKPSKHMLLGMSFNPFDAVDALKRSEDRTRYSN